MTKGEFISQFHVLCKGFRFEATDQQTDAWYRKVQHHALVDWTEAVSTLLCGPRFPLLDPVLAALDHARDHRKRIDQWKDKKESEQVTTRLDAGEVPGLSPELFLTIKVFASRMQVRRYQMQVAANVREQLTPAQREAELKRLQQEDARLTAEYQRLMPMLSKAEADQFTVQYGRAVAA